MADKKRVVLEKVRDDRYLARYDLRVQDPENPEARNILAGVHALSGNEQFNDHIILMMRTPFRVRWRTYPDDAPFGVVHNVREADKGLYEKLRAEAPSIVRQTNEQHHDDFHGFYDETGMGQRYNRVRQKTRK